MAFEPVTFFQNETNKLWTNIVYGKNPMRRNIREIKFYELPSHSHI